MTEDFVPFAHLAAALCFLLAVQGLASAQAACRGICFGVAGMVIAILTALMQPGIHSYTAIVAAVVFGGAAGTVAAKRAPLSTLGHLVTGFHGLVGLAGLLAAIALLIAPGAVHAVPWPWLAVGSGLGAIAAAGALLALLKRWTGPLPWLGSCAGWAVCALGFSLSNLLLVMAGGLAGSSAAALALAQRKAAN